MPLGDSITDGEGSTHLGGYRKDAYNLLTNSGIGVDFVGSLSSGTGFADTDHEGHAGFRADQLLSNVNNYLSLNPPQVVFLQAGSNDITQGDDAVTVLADFDALIDAVYAFDPSISIYLGTIIPRKDNAALQAITDNLNDQLPGLVNTKKQAGVEIYLVDLASAFKNTPNYLTVLYSNDLHPNDDGYTLMAQTYVNAYKSNSGGSGGVSFTDNFDSGSMKPEWVAHQVYQVVNKQLVNTDTQNPNFDGFDNFIAVPNVDVNPNVAEFAYGTNSDQIGRDFTGAIVLMDSPATTGSGYLIFHTTSGGNQRVRMFEVSNGTTVGGTVDDQPALQGPTSVGDVFRVEVSTTATEHVFRVFINGQLDATLRDPQKRQGNSATTYAGIMINNNTNNGVDDFRIERVSDTTPPAAVSDLQVTNALATSIQLQWTAPGDDGFTGVAFEYDLRYSTTPIDASNFDQATAVANVIAPSQPGTVESQNVSGLAAGTTYYFALKSKDDAGNISGLSNVPSASTVAINAIVDDFNRPGPSLGTSWLADPEVQIVDSTVQAVTAIDDWGFAALFKDRANPTEVSWKWSPNATTLGMSFSAMLFLQRLDTNNDGYMIQNRFENGRIILWRVKNGYPLEQIDSGNRNAPPAQPGSEMKVIIRREPEGNIFDVYVDGVFDRTLFDPVKRIGDAEDIFVGMMFNGSLNAQNAIDEFSVAAALGAPSQLVKVSGDAQSVPINQQLPNPLVVQLLDDNANPVESAPIDMIVTQGSATFDRGSTDGNARREAEQAIITGAIEARDDPAASGGKYIVYPTPGNDANAKISFNVLQDGSYYFWTRSLAKDNPQNRYAWDVQIDDGAPFRYNVFQGEVPQPNWKWNRVTKNVGFANNVVTANLTAGLHTLTFHAAHYQTWLDKILVTSDPNYIPSGLEPEQGYITDASGQIQVYVTMGGQVGPVKVQATYAGVPPVVFDLFAQAGAATLISKISGDGQSAGAGQLLAQPFVVEVRDAENNPVLNYPVNFLVTAGGGFLDKAQPVLTDTSGRAAVVLTVGAEGATNKVLAYAPGLTGSPIQFSAGTSGGVAAELQTISGNNQSAGVGDVLPEPLVVRVVDANNQPVSNYPVDFMPVRGGGTTNKTSLPENPGLEGDYYTNNLGVGKVAPGWSGSSSNNSETHARVAGRNSLSAQRINTTGTATNASIYQVISRPPANGTPMMLSFYYRAAGNTNPAMLAQLQNSTNSVLFGLSLPPNDNQWKRVVHYFIWNSSFDPAELHLIAQDDVTIEIDDVNITYLTDAQGRISATWTLGDSAMVQKVDAVALAEGQHLSGSPQSFQATASAGPASKLVEVSGNNQVASADQPLPNPFVVLVQDDLGNSKPGHSVTFTVTQGGGKLSGTQTTQTVLTGADGTASVTLTMGSTPGIINEVRAAADLNGTPLQGSPITFSAIAAIPAKLVKISGDNQTGSAYLPLSAPLKVQVTDGQDRPISGYDVTFTVLEGGGTINGSSSALIKTIGNGEAVATFVLGPTPGTVNKVRVSAIFEGTDLAGSPIILTANAADLSQLVLLDGNNQLGAVGARLGQPLKAKVVDNLGNGIKGWPVEFKVETGGGKLDDVDSVRTVNTDSLGIAKVSLTLGTEPGTNNNSVTAKAIYKSNPLPGSPLVFTASATVDSPVAIRKIGGDAQRGVVGSPLPEMLQVKIVDNFDNGVPGRKVIFKVTAGGGKINNSSIDSVFTNADGIAQVTLVLGSVAGENNNKVEVSSSNGTTPLENSPLLFIASATNSPARNMQYISGSAQGGKSGTVLPKALVVKVTDNSPVRNPVPNHPVTFKVIRGGGWLNGSEQEQVVVATDENGLASATWKLGGLTLPDSQRVEAASTDGQVALNGSPVVFQAGVIAGVTSGTRSVVEATGPIPADGAARSEVTIYLKDDFGNPVPGHAVTIKVSGDGNRINQPLQVSDAQGIVSGSFSSTRAGVKTVTAFDLNAQVEITNGSTVEVQPLAAAKLLMQGGNNQTRNVGTALAEPLMAKVTDVNGNPVAGHPVQFSVESGGGRILESQPRRTDANGFAEATYVLGATPGLNIVKAEGLNLNATPITFNATGRTSSAVGMEIASGNGQSGVAGEYLPAPVSVLVADSNGDPIYNYPVRFRITFGDGTVANNTEATIRTDAFGLAKAAWKLGENAGPNVMWAEANALTGSPQIFTAQASSGRASDMVHVNGNNQSGTVGSQASQALTVRITDRNGNPVSNVIVNYQITYGSGSLSSTQQATNDDGMASVRFTYGNESGERVVRASAYGLMGSPLNFHLFGNAALPKRVEIVDGNNQSGTRGKPLSYPARIAVFDRHNNPVPNASVNFVITAGGGRFVEQQPVRANDRGIAQVTWILGNNAGDNKIWAVVQGADNSPLEFIAGGSNNNFPVFKPVSAQEINELERVEFEIRATDQDGDPVSYGIRNLPNGATFDSLASRVFSWQTGYSDAGVHEVVFVARDSKGGVSEMLVQITVNDVNRAPVLDNWQPATSDVDITDGQTKTFTVSASDPDGDQVGYLWFLDGMHVGSTNSYDFQPLADASYRLEAKAFDRSDTTVQRWTVNTTVAVNLVSFSASASPTGEVELQWLTSRESGNAGFNVLRSTHRPGSYETINEELIRANDSGDYKFVDTEVEPGNRYYYMLEDVAVSGEKTLHGPVMVEMALPKTYSLSQNFPNPFNPSTNIKFELPQASDVFLRIYNTLGQEVRTLVNQQMNAGLHSVVWDGRNASGHVVPSGIYYYVFRANDFVAKKKMLMLK